MYRALIFSSGGTVVVAGRLARGRASRSEPEHVAGAKTG